MIESHSDLPPLVRQLLSPMTTERLLDICRDRDISFCIDGDRLVMKKGPNAFVTDKLLVVLKIHRERIIEYLKRSPS